jgi:O-6-methylguanine DNA methyltransferase
MSEQLALWELASPLGTLRLAATPKGLVRIAFPRSRGLAFQGWVERHIPEASKVDWVPTVDKANAELDDYFAGRLTVFSAPLDLRGTPFQIAVWEHLRRIPYGEVESYGHVARALRRPNASRAVGGAVGANPVPILVPCHRVIAGNGRLGGFGGGLQAKRKLLALERARPPKGTLL